MFWKVQAIFLKFANWKVEWYYLLQPIIILCVVSVIRLKRQTQMIKTPRKQTEQAANEAEREDSSGLSMTELSLLSNS